MASKRGQHMKSMEFLVAKAFITHGHTTRDVRCSSTYQSWRGMIQRCQNPKAANYARYGGKGVTVCERWSRFSNFLADMGERPDGRTLNRIKNSIGYIPGNCNWATSAEQAENKKKWWLNG